MIRTRVFFSAWLVILGVAIMAGLFSAFQLLTKGHYLFATNDVILWSLPLGVYIHLALTSSGLTLLASMPLVFGVKRLEPIAGRLVFLAIATLMGGFIAIGLELGNVFHMVYIMLSPNLSSPIWWMGFIYSVELVVLLAKFIRIRKGDHHSRVTRNLGRISFFASLTAPLMIGSVFGITESRVTYFGPVMSIYCLLMAILSGSALGLFHHMFMAWLHEKPNPLTANGGGVTESLTRIFNYALGSVILLSTVKVAIESATVIPEFLNYRQYAQIFGGIGKLNTEILLGLALPFILMMVPASRRSQAAVTAASGLVIAGTLAMHMEILLAGQSRPIGPKAEQYPDYISYMPSTHEWMVMLFSLAVTLLVITLGERFLNLTEHPPPGENLRLKGEPWTVQGQPTL